MRYGRWKKLGAGGRAYSLSAVGLKPVAPMVEKELSDLFSTNPCYAGRFKGSVDKLPCIKRYPVRNARRSGPSTLTSAGIGKCLRSVRTPFCSRMQAYRSSFCSFVCPSKALISKTSQRFLSCEGIINGSLAGLIQASLTNTTRSISPTVPDCANCIAACIICSARPIGFCDCGMGNETCFLVPHTYSVGGIPPSLYIACLAVVIISSGIVIVVSPPLSGLYASCCSPRRA
jgi:hypothetical protein